MSISSIQSVKDGATSLTNRVGLGNDSHYYTLRDRLGELIRTDMETANLILWLLVSGAAGFLLFLLIGLRAGNFLFLVIFWFVLPVAFSVLLTMALFLIYQVKDLCNL